MSTRSTSSSYHCWLHQHHYHPHHHHNDHLNNGGPNGEALASLELGGEREKASVLHVQVAVHLVKEGERLYFEWVFSLGTICCPSGQGGRMVTF